MKNEDFLLSYVRGSMMHLENKIQMLKELPIDENGLMEAFNDGEICAYRKSIISIQLAIETYYKAIESMKEKNDRTT